jgi:hypothetical protein
MTRKDDKGGEKLGALKLNTSTLRKIVRETRIDLIKCRSQNIDAITI